MVASGPSTADGTVGGSELWNAEMVGQSTDFWRVADDLLRRWDE